MASTANIVFRTEQLQAIEMTVKALERNRKMLWNAKMRFGKTLCALEVARRRGCMRTLILTHRPNVRHEWFETFHKLGLDGWQYGTRNDFQLPDDNTPYVYFASMQDLRGSKRVNRDKGIEKNEEIFATRWDLLIVDEAHEGIVSRLGREVMAEIQKQRNLRTLYLSGTPYNIQSLFDTEEVFHWDYCMEQTAKENWPKLHPDTPNPYEGLARMNIMTYNLGKQLRNYRTDDGEGFAFAELFRTQETPSHGEATAAEALVSFVHEDDVRKLLILIGKDSKYRLYPYANASLKGSLDHTLWYVPGVRAAACLAKMLAEDNDNNPFRGYHVVNVAGDISSENDRNTIYERARIENDALQRVKNAIKTHDKTITLSCGRLTMGVSVPEWTAVMMMAGSADKGSMRYFQTIFRCQSPYHDSSKVKKECYAIDFSPRRTLTTVDQYINNNLSSDSHEGRMDKTAEFLRLCPLTEIQDNKAVTLDMGKFMREINSTYSTSLMRNGFRGDLLYGNLDNMRSQDMKLIDQVAEAIRQGMVSERQKTREKMREYAPNDKVRTSAKRRRTTQEEEPATPAATLEQHETPQRLTPRQRAINILNQISTRFPIMIYGTVENVDALTLDSFISHIDEDSWRAFMPKGVSVRLFQKLKRFYREDIFVATARAIVERLRRADTLPVAERVAEMAGILSDFCYPDRETVLTPWRTVNRHMSDTLGGWCFYDETFTHTLDMPRLVRHDGVTGKVFLNPDTKILDIASKTGLYSLYAAYSIYKMRNSQSQGLFDMLSDEESRSLWDEILHKNIFAVCRSRMEQLVTLRTLTGFRKESRPNVAYLKDFTPMVMVYRHKFIRKITDGKNFWQANNNEQMKFDAIIGNPPYQVNIGEQKDNYGIPLYNQFVETARDISPDFITMIMPSRWFTGGRGLDAFRRNMLADRRMRSIFDFVDSKECFPTVDISGGVDYFLWDAAHDAQCRFTNTLHGISDTRERQLDQFPVFVRNNGALTFINKVMDRTQDTLSSQVSGQTPFGFVSTYRGKAEAVNGDDVALKSSGATTYVTRSDVKKNAQWIDSYKVIFSKATCEHAGTPDRNGQYRVLSSPSILEPGTVCTQSYLVGGAYATKEEAQHLLAYLSTRFVRYLMLQTITSQDLSPDKFMFVPVQDFTSQSDIRWSDSTDDIDSQLYDKYGISEKERLTVLNTIKSL